MSGSAYHSFKHWHNARPLENVPLTRILFEDLGKGKALDRALAIVVDEWSDGDVRRIVVSFFDCEESWASWIGRAQAQIHVEKGARGPLWRFHGHHKRFRG